MEEAAVQTASSQTPRPPPPPSPAVIVRGGCVCSESTVVLSHDVFIARGACSRCTQHSQYAAFHISRFDQLRQIKQDYCTNRVHSPLSKTNIIVTQIATMFRAPNDYMLLNMTFMQIQIDKYVFYNNILLLLTEIADRVNFPFSLIPKIKKEI